jgi:hypothetical protein
MGRKKRQQRQIVVRGTVTPVEWEEDRTLSPVWILADDERRYEVFDDEVGQELLDYPHETVQAWGVMEQIGGQLLFRVKRFEPLSFEDGDLPFWEESYD